MEVGVGLVVRGLMQLRVFGCSLEVYGINLRVRTRGSGRSASLASLIVVILYHKRVI